MSRSKLKLHWRDSGFQTKRKKIKDIEPVGHNFEAVVKFYIYKVNDRHRNPDKPSFV